MILPPYAALIGAVIDPGTDEPVLVMPFCDAVLGRPGFLHGGAIAGLMEMAAIAALQQALEAEAGDGAEVGAEVGADGATPRARIKPINVTVDFMRGGRDKDTRAAGRVTRLGTRVANVEAIAWQDDAERPIAAARMNYLLDR